MTTASSDERGSGVLSATFGLTVVIILMAFSSHVLLNLWLQSSIHAVAVDAATTVATSEASSNDERHAAERDALRTARSNVGGYADRITFEFRHDTGPDQVVLHVRGEGFSLMPFGSTLGIGNLDREIRVPREVPR